MTWRTVFWTTFCLCPEFENVLKNTCAKIQNLNVQYPIAISQQFAAMYTNQQQLRNLALFVKIFITSSGSLPCMKMSTLFTIATFYQTWKPINIADDIQHTTCWDRDEPTERC